MRGNWINRRSEIIPGRRCNAGRAIVVFMLPAVFSLILLAGCRDNGTADAKDVYTCPMHPTVVSEQPGACPVCGMDLVRRASSAQEVEITEDLSTLLKSANGLAGSSVETIKAQYRSVTYAVEASGIVTYDTKKIYTIPARTSGRVERVYVKYEYQPISRGQRIADIYSPELSSAQKELLYLLENDPGNKRLIEAATTKLKLLGLSSRQIDRIASSRSIDSTITLYSPYNGYVISSETISPTEPAGKQFVREGDYVTAGQTLFTVVNTKDLRVELDLTSAEAADVRKGTRVTLNFGQGQTEAGTVDFVQPFFTEGQEFVKIRIYTNRSGLQVGQLVSAVLQFSTEGLWVPRESVADLGSRQIVFTKVRGVLKPVTVTTGISTDSLVEIKSGLATTDEVVASAAYVVDSDTFIKAEE